jgi:hypothetical protein
MGDYTSTSTSDFIEFYSTNTNNIPVIEFEFIPYEYEEEVYL